MKDDKTVDDVVKEIEEEAPAEEPEVEYDVEELPEPEAEAEDPEGDLKTAYTELRQQMLEERQVNMAHRVEGDRLVRAMRDKLETMKQRAPTSDDDDDDPWGDHRVAPPQQAGDPAVRQEINAMRQELAAMRSERQQEGLRTSIESQVEAVNEQYGLPLLEFENVVYEMQQNRGMSAATAAKAVAKRRLGQFREMGIVKRTPRERAPDMLGGLRSTRQFTMPKEAATDRDGLDKDIDAFLDQLGDEQLM